MGLRKYFFGETPPSPLKIMYFQNSQKWNHIVAVLAKGWLQKLLLKILKERCQAKFLEGQNQGPWFSQTARQNCGWNRMLGPIRGLVHRLCPSRNFAWHPSFNPSRYTFLYTILLITHKLTDHPMLLSQNVYIYLSLYVFQIIFGVNLEWEMSDFHKAVCLN